MGVTNVMVGGLLGYVSGIMMSSFQRPSSVSGQEVDGKSHMDGLLWYAVPWTPLSTAVQWVSSWSLIGPRWSSASLGSFSYDRNSCSSLLVTCLEAIRESDVFWCCLELSFGQQRKVWGCELTSMMLGIPFVRRMGISFVLSHSISVRHNLQYRHDGPFGRRLDSPQSRWLSTVLGRRLHRRGGCQWPH